MSNDDPADRLDDSFYSPFGGAEPMGPPLRDEQAMLLDQPVEGEGEAALSQYADRREMAADLLAKSRDLRAFARFVEAHAYLEGPKGLHAGLHMLEHVVRNQWDTLHPAPPDERTARNARLRVFAPFRERRIISSFDRLVLFNAGGFEREVTLRHAWIATERHVATRRKPPREGEPVYDQETFRALVLRAEATEAVAEIHAALARSAALLRSMEAFLVAQPDYDRLRFNEPIVELETYAAALAPFVAAAAPVPAASDGEAGADATQAGGPAAASALPGSLSTRAEAIALLDAVLAYYATEARSSPVALALLKIRDLQGATFEQWLAEVSPDDAETVRLPLSGLDQDRLDAFAAPSDTAAPPPPALPEAALAPLTEAVASLQAHEGAVAAAASEIEALATALDVLRAAIQPPVTTSTPDTPQAGGPVIRDRAAVRQALQKLAAHFRTTEPSSPASLCFERLIDLVDRGFVDILQRIAPSGPGSAALKLT